jgi:hypothetical protein
MPLARTLVAAVTLVASFGANAVITGTLGTGPTGPVIPLTTEAFGQPCVAAPSGNNCSLGPLANPIATIVGGTIYASDMQFADDVLPNTPFYAVGPSSTAPGVMTYLNGGLSFLGMLWGSPDTYNVLTLRDNLNVDYVFTAASLGFSVQNGDQSFNQYVQFAASGTTRIVQATFASSIDAFETTQFTVTPIPEPETYALMLAGLAALGFVRRRRNLS